MEWIKRKPVKRIKNTDSVLEKLAKIRGIEDLDKFLNPSKNSLHNPYKLKNIEEVTNKIIKAVYQGKRICVSADCDSDGIFSTAMMVRFLKQFTDNIYYIYNQRSIGHGIENQIQYINDETDLLIILDSSTNSTDACKAISKNGIDIVIIDHHAFERKNPYATIVNPQLDHYPNKSISGAGLTFKVMQVIDDNLGSETFENYIDMCGMGMYADMMDCSVLENRYMISKGLKNINNPGVQVILNLKNIDVISIDSQTIAYIISPLINGCARMDKIELALELLISDDYLRCVEIVEEMIELNEERKQIQKILFEKCLPQIKEEDKFIVAAIKDISKGFNGLVAQQLTDQFNKPSIVLKGGEILTGSFRACGELKNMKEFLKKTGVVNKAEGHEFAGGVEISKDKLNSLKTFVNEKLEKYKFTPVFEYDLEISVDDISFGMIKEVEKFNHISGTGFPAATFKVDRIVTGERKVLGKNKDTIKVVCNEIELMKFKTDKTYAEDVMDLDELEVVGQLKINEFIPTWGKGKKLVRNKQIIIEDYKAV
ncbi:single-stranded-DNA-specific exonuclease RecJ [Chengkuizengella marina]|uniref:Single-stranded-DNA-specific exonuclease RecJ n=1 Tax=Chengkuizengella marina TaxID=2507566 RepID=A0A6N9Q8S5_9BACL|nr:DHH family phosphoesterase [Chengkuizengella marina]NBI31004.1 hypothetical protein [Chengkuizengella marina]